MSFPFAKLFRLSYADDLTTLKIHKHMHTKIFKNNNQEKLKHIVTGLIMKETLYNLHTWIDMVYMYTGWLTTP